MPQDETKPTIESRSRACTDQLFAVVQADTSRILDQLAASEKTTRLAADIAKLPAGHQLGYRVTAEDAEKLLSYADLILKLEQARAFARKSDAEIEALVLEKMRHAVEAASESGGGLP